MTREPQTPEPAPAVVHYVPWSRATPNTADIAKVTCTRCIDAEPYQRALAAVAEEYGDPIPEATALGDAPAFAITGEPRTVPEIREVWTVLDGPLTEGQDTPTFSTMSQAWSWLQARDALSTITPSHDADDQCAACGAHIADPHAVGCPCAVI